jgi:U3 small nucleolar RNA-associated protein 23
MIMEPMADASTGNREREERGKFRDGIKRGSGSLKRKREDGEEVPGDVAADIDGVKKSKKRKGQKEPNPLSMKKPKKKPEETNAKPAKSALKETENRIGGSTEATAEGSDPSIKRKRRRKHKSAVGTDETVDPVETED